MHILDDGGIAYTGMFLWLCVGRNLGLYPHGSDHAQIHPADNSNVIEYLKPDKVLTFDMLTSVALTGINHEQCLQVKITSGNRNIIGNVRTYWIHVNVWISSRSYFNGQKLHGVLASYTCLQPLLLYSWNQSGK